MARKCKGGAHDGASIYIDSQERECISNGGQVEDSSGGCSSATVQSLRMPESPPEAVAAWHAVDELILFPLRMARARFGAHPFLTGADDEFTQVIKGLFLEDEELREQTFHLLLHVSGAAATLLEYESGNEVAGTFTVTEELVDRGARLADEISARTSDDRLRSALADAVPLARALVGTPFSDVSALLNPQGSGA